MVKVILGWMNEEHGTVEAVPSGGPLVYACLDPDQVRELVEAKRRWYDRAGELHTLTDAELIRSLPYRLQGQLWAVFVDEETGLTQEQPPYDPWGEKWWHPEASIRLSQSQRLPRRSSSPPGLGMFDDEPR